MKALTLVQPWAYAITDRGKRVENRGWAPRGHYHMLELALHAGRRYDRSRFGRRLEHELELPVGAMMPHGAVVGVCRLVCVVRSRDQVEPEQRRWWVGPCGWILDSVRKIEPVTCVGHLGLWTLPEDAEAKVVAALLRSSS